MQVRKEIWLPDSGVGGSHLRAVSLRGDLCEGTHLPVNLPAACWLNFQGVAGTVGGLWQSCRYYLTEAWSKVVSTEKGGAAGGGGGSKWERCYIHITFNSILVIISFTDRCLLRVFCSIPVFLLAHITEWNLKVPMQFLSVFTQSPVRRVLLLWCLLMGFTSYVRFGTKQRINKIPHEAWERGNLIERRTVVWDMDFYLVS